MFFEIHTHDEYSLFDGFSKAEKNAKKAKLNNQKALGLTNHGNITGLIKHFKACKEEEVIPILGCEFYFQPKIDKEKPKYHLCLYAKNMQGWKNLNKLTTISNSDDHYYYTGVLSFEDLRNNSEGIICSSACIGGYIAKLVTENNLEKAEKAADKFYKIFEEDFYIEIMPFELEGNGLKDIQITTNKKLLEIAEEKGISAIVTSDCHYTNQEDFDTYQKMHEIKKSTYGSHYQDRYMHSEEEIDERIKKYHPKYEKFIKSGMKKFFKTTEDIFDWFVFDDVDMPQYSEDSELTYKTMVKQCIGKLKEDGKTSQTYKDRLKFELDVIKYHGFQDYFMIVSEYVNWAKEHDVPVGPGRGSAGNSLVNYALNITDLDPVYFDNNFDRFLRKDKKKFPDIDVDFCTKKREKVIKHILEVYPGQAAQTLTYGTYNVLNLVNDLVKPCGLTDKEEIKKLKKFLYLYCDDSEHVINESLLNKSEAKFYNKNYDNIIKHFVKMYGKVRFFGTHASSVILCSDIESQAGLLKIGGLHRTSFDLKDIEFLKLVKLDILGLSTVTKVDALRKKTKTKFTYDILEDEKMLERFNEEGMANVFQFESASACDIARRINITSFEDIVVSTCLNRPGPLSMGLDKKYAEAKANPNKSNPWYKYTANTYGILVYQEQGMAICRNIGMLDPENTDKLVKADILHISKEQQDIWKTEFYKGAKKYGLSKDEMEEVFGSLLLYSFNRGHGVAYAMLSAELMYYKTYYPLLFWYYTLKHENNEDKIKIQKANAVKEGIVLLLPHVNGSADFSIQTIDGEKCIQEGLSTLKGVGEKAAIEIVKERKARGDFTSEEDFLERISEHIDKRICNKRSVEVLKEEGALTFDEDVFYNRVAKYNKMLYIRSNS